MKRSLEGLFGNGESCRRGLGDAIDLDGLGRFEKREKARPPIGDGGLRTSRPTPTAVLVAVNDETSRAESMRIAAALRERGIPTLVSPKAAKFGKQIQFADRRGIPYVWFPGAGETGDQIKDIRSGEQFDADATSWVLPAADEQVRLEVAEASPAS